MTVVRSTDSRWLSHSWLVAAGPGQPAIVVDAGAPPEPLLRAAREAGLRVELVVLTHHHVDHVHMRAAFAPAPCIIHALDAEHVPDCARHALHGERLRVGVMDLTFLHIPGHTRGQLGLSVAVKGEPRRVFTGDTLFRGSVRIGIPNGLPVSAASYSACAWTGRNTPSSDVSATRPPGSSVPRRRLARGLASRQR